MGDDTPPMKQAVANARLIAAAPDLAEAAALQEAAEDAHANCIRCIGAAVLCHRCFPLFDAARVKRRAALAKARGEDVEKHGLRQTLRQGAATSAINLLNAIRGEP